MPDTFSLFLLGADGQSLLCTSDPTGADALLLYSLGSGQAPNVYLASMATVTVSAEFALK